ncbi:hypothetical protein LG943_00710 [Streptomonospora sp. S1-112]|uniref:Uncharacterized protein n=1 Tax=Streptomonospora mangrovi TaxID=2883123 RepID=A0A9X3NFV3_9ACTN|nr:hypothetical protein [Streptomonospora mangrovi]MDA0562864.1 hypothetical protein [Streptomonospora mangrovi]
MSTATVTVSLAGPVAAVAHVADGARVLVVDDGAVSLRLDLSQVAEGDAATLVHGLMRAAGEIGDAVGALVHPTLPPPPYAVDTDWESR